MDPFTASYRTLKKIESFSDLKRGWCYGQGGPLALGTITHATGLLTSLVQMGFLENDAFPGVEGEILVSAYVGDANIDITVFVDGETSLVAEMADHEVLALPKSPSTRIDEHIQAALAIIWNSSDSSIRNTSIKAKVASKVWPSKTLPIRVERQFSNGSVASKPQATSALISSDFIGTSVAIQRSSGFLTQVGSLQRAA